MSANKQNNKYIRNTFPVLEMTCAACAVSVESMLKSAPGVKMASVNFANQTAAVEYDSTAIKPIDLQNTVRSIGYDLVIDTENAQQIQEDAQHHYYEAVKKRTIWSTALSIPVVVLGMFFMDWIPGRFISMALTAPVVFYFGRSFFINAWKQGRH